MTLSGNIRIRHAFNIALDLRYSIHHSARPSALVHYVLEYNIMLQHRSFFASRRDIEWLSDVFRRRISTTLRTGIGSDTQKDKTVNSLHLHISGSRDTRIDPPLGQMPAHVGTSQSVPDLVVTKRTSPGITKTRRYRR